MDYEALITRLHNSGNFRSIPPLHDSAIDRPIDFSSNDYLGLATRTELHDEFMASDSNRSIPFTSSASRLLAGRQNEYYRLEDLLASLYPGHAALIFNSGYHANTGMISALADRDTLIVADRLIHASIIDGIILSRAEHVRFAHNDFDELDRILRRKASVRQKVIVAVESVYSMDGDSAPLTRLAEIKKRYPQILLYVDEAHAFGVRGPKGLGLASALDDGGRCIDVVIGTLGKAAASSGAFAVMSPLLKEVAINCARSFIFSTVLPPICAAWSSFIIEKITSMDAERNHLMALARRLHDGLSDLPGRSPSTSPSYIYPYIVGDAELTMKLSRQLLREGLKVLPIRTPTVPKGTERLRISLSASHTPEQIDHLIDALRRFAK